MIRNDDRDDVMKDKTIIRVENMDEGIELDGEKTEAWLDDLDRCLPTSVIIHEDGSCKGMELLSADIKESGYSSRISEANGDRHQTAPDHRVLVKRLHRISECQSQDDCKCTFSSVWRIVAKILAVLFLLYTFICTLDLLSNAFRLLGGKTAGSVFQDSELLKNPITGLMIGVLATVILQSSSTSTSIVITMVASGIIDIRPAIPIIMGANIGTTVTNTIVSLAHSMDRKEFKRAFSGAVIHDVFNWLSVIILLPLEVMTGYLYLLTDKIVGSMQLKDMKTKKHDLLKKITKPLTSRIVQVDKKVITGIAKGDLTYQNKTLLKVYCTFDKVYDSVLVNETSINNQTGEEMWSLVNKTTEKEIPLEKCNSLFSTIGWSDLTSGIILFIFSLLLLTFCLVLMVKTLHSLLGGHIAKAARKTINADLPYPFSWLTGYVAIIVGAAMTILVQSSSVFTSALTPLVGVGCLKLERMLPLTLGSNIGTTGTGILAALASDPSTMAIALQLAFCHLFFNISGILLFYPIPYMRKIVIRTAKFLGRTTAMYRWFAIMYLIFMFVVFPGFFFSVSFAGKIVFFTVISIIFVIVLFIICVNVMQRSTKLKRFLPSFLLNWHFLPEFMRSLAPFDRLFMKMFSPFKKCCCACCLDKCKCLEQNDEDMGYIDSDSDDSDDSVQSSYLPSAVSSKSYLPGACSSSEVSRKHIFRPNSRKSSKQNLISESSVRKNLVPLLNEAKDGKAEFFIGNNPKADLHVAFSHITVETLDNCKESDI